MIGTFRLLLVALLAVICYGRVWKLYLMDLERFPNAVCLDGSPAGFWYLESEFVTVKDTNTNTHHYRSKEDQFVIYHQGGAWCNNVDDCYSRSLDFLGSSNSWERNPDCLNGSTALPCTWNGGHGIFGSSSLVNPLFAHSAKIHIGYCDGGSYSGHLEHPIWVDDQGKVVIHLKGRYILDAIYDTLLTDFGMTYAKEVIISGASAGGVAVYLHADYLSTKITNHAMMTQKQINGSPAAATPPRVTAVADAGFFPDLPSITGDYLYTPLYKSIFNLHHMRDSVNQDCIDYYSPHKEEWKCFMAQYTLPFIKTPLYIVNSMSDSWVTQNIMGIYCNPSMDTNTCTEEELAFFDTFRQEILNIPQLKQYISKSTSGLWLCECWAHSVLNFDNYWLLTEVQGSNIRKSFNNWYLGKNPETWIAIDGQWGSNKCGITTVG